MMNWINNIIKSFKLIYYIICYGLFKIPNLKSINSNKLHKAKSIAYGNKLAIVCQKFGPIYIKFGQTLSTRPDLVGEEIADALKVLQDRLPPFATQIVHTVIEKELNKTTETLFIEFDDEPIAAASIAQVHKAKLISGEIVAVKILRPSIKSIYLQDIKFLYFIAKIINFLSHKLAKLKFYEAVKLFENSMNIELDLRLEAAAYAEFRNANRYLNDIHIPKVFWSYTTETILVTEWIAGFSIYNKQQFLEHDIKPKNIAAKLAINFFDQAFDKGYFHADLHPGNIIVLADGKVALIDFGIMGRLTELDRLTVAEILYGFLQQDYLRVAKLHVKVGWVDKNTNIEQFAQSCRAIGEPIVGLPVAAISIGNLLAQLLKVTEDFRMNIQPQLFLLQKTMIVLEGIGKQLDPDINMWILAEDWIKKWAIQNLTPEAKLLRYVKKKFSEIIDDVEMYDN